MNKSMQSFNKFSRHQKKKKELEYYFSNIFHTFIFTEPETHADFIYFTFVLEQGPQGPQRLSCLNSLKFNYF